MTIVIVGAGPAGLAAAQTAASTGAQVTLIDDNHAPGGQIWRGTAVAQTAGVRTLLGTRVLSANSRELLLDSGTLPYDKLIIAAGAREFFLPFPGWSLPGVFGAGGLQALAKSGLAVAGKRIVVAGTGPLLLAVAHYLKRHGANVLRIAEQAPWSALLPFAAALPASKWAEALRLWSPRFSPGTWVTHAHGTGCLEGVTLRTSIGDREIACDYLATGYGLVPNQELPALLGIDPVSVDEFQSTSNPAIFCAGEVTGVGGVETSVLEGRIAGYAAAGAPEKARALFEERRRWTKFQQALDRAFALRPELRQLPKHDTIVCRCEDVTYRELTGRTGWRDAKIHTRCGMGPCQGRVCGPAANFLFGWPADSVRPPIFPATVASLAIMHPYDD